MFNYTRQINDFQRGMADIKIMRHPLRKEFTAILNDRIADVYMDTSLVEVERVKIWGILWKDPNLRYIQLMDNPAELLDEMDKPWMCYFTDTNLPRILRKDDYLLLGDHKYSISEVHPINRDRPSVFVCFIYPERDETETD